ncbi:DUF2802 domain-containing protein [Legionella drozanskii]|uniref:DUF2802 domain-containing protein n=1 Tax=Legionella drozanskii LLAP-1 TaxID=1212489 RepID=A0A0W0SR39_9GAMM|nr:DUF2802 domain-containing protein [Legionella drozanskii]KTC85747.1 hypothetical protein Ldro_2072 [Legionella drozanskii LLAP-1]
MSIILSIGGLLLALLSLKALITYHRMFMKMARQVKELNTELEQLQVNHNLLVNADLGFGKQITEINRQLISMDNQLQALENKRDNDGGYQHALRILEMGGNKDEIIDSCHLSNAEAELLMNLQAYRSVIKKHRKTVID